MDGLDVFDREAAGTASSGWDLIAAHDGAAALVEAGLDVDPEDAYTTRELSERAGISYKSLYLGEALDALVDAGFFERRDPADGETRFSPNPDSDVYRAAAAFETAAGRERTTAE